MYERLLDELISGELIVNQYALFGYRMGGSDVSIIETYFMSDIEEVKKDCLYALLGKIKIEKRAKELSIEMEWRACCDFDSRFVAEDNKEIASHFFMQSSGISELIDSFRFHTGKIVSLWDRTRICCGCPWEFPPLLLSSCMGPLSDSVLSI